MTTQQRALVQPCPYTAESARSSLLCSPQEQRIHAERAEAWAGWLAKNEPLHAAEERERSHEGDDFDVIELTPHKRAEMFAVRSYGPTREQWRSHWRSLPDYDGPPMRSPSGVGYWTYREITPFDRTAAAELRITQAPDDGRVDEHGVVRYASWYMENFRATRLITDCFDPPSRGGRGWCPKLAGVE